VAKVKYNVKGVDRGGNFEQPKPGLYEMEIKEANLRDKDGKNDIELVLEITKNNDEHVGARVWSYVGLGDASQWKLAELIDALGLPEGGTLDTVKLVGKKMKVKVSADSWNNEYRARAGRFSPLAAGAEGDDNDDPDDPDAGNDEAIVLELNDVELSTDPEFYEDWSDDDVFEEVENQSLELKGKAAKNRAKVIEALIAKVKEEHAGSGANDEPDDGNYDDTDVWSDKDLAAEYKKRGLDTIKGKKDRAKVIEALRADDADDDDPFAED
jgi:hypothetical protein